MFIGFGKDACPVGKRYASPKSQSLSDKKQPIGYASKGYSFYPKRCRPFEKEVHTFRHIFSSPLRQYYTLPSIYHKGHEENLRALSYLYPVKDSVYVS